MYRAIGSAQAGHMMPLDGLLTIGLGLVFVAMLPSLLHQLQVTFDREQEQVKVAMRSLSGRLEQSFPVDESRILLRRWSEPSASPEMGGEASVLLQLPEHLIWMYSGRFEILELLAEDLRKESGISKALDEKGDDDSFLQTLKKSVG
ncbi:MAG: hypothetical protein AAF560_25605, partial [Acidobacteriota bacterium]